MSIVQKIKYYDLPIYNDITKNVETSFIPEMDAIKKSYNDSKNDIKKAEDNIKNNVSSIKLKIQEKKEIGKKNEILREIIKNVANLELQITKKIIENLENYCNQEKLPEIQSLLKLGIDELKEYLKIVNPERENFDVPSWINE